MFLLALHLYICTHKMKLMCAACDKMDSKGNFKSITCNLRTPLSWQTGQNDFKYLLTTFGIITLFTEMWGYLEVKINEPFVGKLSTVN